MKTFKLLFIVFVICLANSVLVIYLYVKMNHIQDSIFETISEVKELKMYNNKTKIVFENPEEFKCLAENIYYESRGEPLIGKIAVAQTVFNRAESGRWGRSFCSVVNAPYQFSWTLQKNKKPSGPDWKESVKAAKMFISGTRVENMEKTDHYHNNTVDPYWNKTMKSVGRIGNHLFFASK